MAGQHPDFSDSDVDEEYLVVGDTLVPVPRVSPPALAAPSHDEPASESLVGVLERPDSSEVSREP